MNVTTNGTTSLQMERFGTVRSVLTGTDHRSLHTDLTPTRAAKRRDVSRTHLMQGDASSVRGRRGWAVGGGVGLQTGDGGTQGASQVPSLEHREPV